MVPETRNAFSWAVSSCKVYICLYVCMCARERERERERESIRARAHTHTHTHTHLQKRVGGATYGTHQLSLLLTAVGLKEVVINAMEHCLEGGLVN